MSTSGLMSIGLRAMMANSAALQVTGHNIANANVAGYSRQSAVLQTSEGQFTGAGYFGKGSAVVDVRRAHDEFLSAQVQAAKSLAKMDETRAAQLEQLQDVFPSGSAGLGYAMGDFLNAVADMGNSPADNSARQVVLARASDVAARFATADERIQVLQAGVRSDLSASVDTVNGLARNIADLNQRIAEVYALSQKPNDLLDQRDSMIQQLGEYLQLSTVPSSDGTVGVFLAGGQRLVLGNEASTLVAGPDSNDPSRMSLSLETEGQQTPLSDGLISGGSMVGLLRFQNTDLVDARNRLGQMAAAFTRAINEAQSRGLDLNGGEGDPLFSVNTPQAIANAHNQKDAAGNYLATARLDITDYRQLQASDYSVERDPGDSSKLRITRLSDGHQYSGVADSDSTDAFFTAEIDGFKLILSPASLPSGDRFLLQPVGNAAAGMRRVLDDPLGIAAAAPYSAVMGSANQGTGTVSSLTMTGQKPASLTGVDVTFGAETVLAADTTLEDGTVVPAGTHAVNYSWTTSGSGGTSGTSFWVPGHAIGAGSGAQLALQINGTPKAGDTISIAVTPFPETNNGNALQMNALRGDAFVGSSGSASDGATLTDAYANAMADIGVRVQTAQSASKISTASSTQAQLVLSSKTGVNLDEEAARLLQFQQSYQAAAKVLQVAQQVFDTMLQLGR